MASESQSSHSIAESPLAALRHAVSERRIVGHEAPSTPVLAPPQDEVPADPASLFDGDVEATQPTLRKQRSQVPTMEGHRQRVRARFDRGEAIADYELLELLLFRSVPRRDTKPIARALIGRFGSFANALAAPQHTLMEVDGIGEKVATDFRLVRAAAERFAHAQLTQRDLLSSTDAVVDYYKARLRTALREEFHILFLDKRNKFIASECAHVGTVDHTPVYPREVLTRALEHAASAVVLVHNHPSGDPTPSRADIAMTQKIVEAATPLGVAVHDHLIIAGDGYTSLRAERLM